MKAAATATSRTIVSKVGINFLSFAKGYYSPRIWLDIHRSAEISVKVQPPRKKTMVVVDRSLGIMAAVRTLGSRRNLRHRQITTYAVRGPCSPDHRAVAQYPPLPQVHF